MSLGRDPIRKDTSPVFILEAFKENRGGLIARKAPRLFLKPKNLVEYKRGQIIHRPSVSNHKGVSLPCEKAHSTLVA